MRILHIIPDMSPKSGGPPQAVRGLAMMLMRMGHTVEIACLESEANLRTRELPVKTYGLGRGIGQHAINPRLTFWVARHAQDYDCVILHSLWNYASVGAWFALRRQKTPYYIFSHGMMAPWFRQKYPIKHVIKQIYWWLVQGRVLRDAKFVLFTCDEERVEARGVFSGFSYRERVVQYGTTIPDSEAGDDEAAFYGAYPQLRDKRFLLFISRIHPKKGCDLLIRAFAECVKMLPPDLDLVIAGPDEVGWVGELRAETEKLEIADRVHWPGMLTGNTKWGALRAADAMILPSHQENFGFVVAEAMGCATPVLISDKINIWREVQACGSGLVEPDTQPGTVNLIRRFYSLSTEERARMRRAAREGFYKNFDLNVTSLDFARAIGAER